MAVASSVPAPASQSAPAASACPWMAARCRGVHPSPSAESTSA
eukprot:CAMPEP_0182875016 /NCGR_PEP_ID=MMETSP0034_2-20130328/13290_1 /TAXON_ID=156128 /ORGANISM="Nephroselmis pyriformis, Strain CCMP717" /LENGTH=42 /DNA_ID= /DNA_START= /DNA_END= /DNA_ORIENTATION=